MGQMDKSAKLMSQMSRAMTENLLLCGDSACVTRNDLANDLASALAIQTLIPVSLLGRLSCTSAGGGFFGLSVQEVEDLLKKYVSESKTTIYAVDYRLAPEHPYPTPVEDCFAALEYLSTNAGKLGIDPRRIALMGNGAGGGLCAGTAILARDRGVRVAKQIVINGNLDDRNAALSSVPGLGQVHWLCSRNAPLSAVPYVREADWTWSSEESITAWNAYLGEGHETDESIKADAAPARLEDAKGLAPLYVEVLGLDTLCHQGIAYALKLRAQGVEVELHMNNGTPDDFELQAPDHRMAKASMENRVGAMTSF